MRFTAIAALVAIGFAHVPLRPIGTVVVAAAIVLAVVFRKIVLTRRPFATMTMAIVCLLVLKLALSLFLTESGWAARYFRNDSWTGSPEWSSDFRRSDVTRIDREVSFKDDSFPAHYLNDHSSRVFDRREVVEPMTVEWDGWTFLDAPRKERFALRARGDATVSLDRRVIVAVSSAKTPGEADLMVDLSAGSHAVSVRYRKPADTDGLIAFSSRLAIAPVPVGHAEGVGHTAGAAASVVIDAALIVMLAVATVAAFRALGRSDAHASTHLVPLGLVALFGLQGWSAAHALANRVVALTVGDDWWGFEMCARDILRHGLLMPLGQPVGRGEPYFYHPLYCYFLAAVHAVTGESLFGPVFVQFLILAAVALLVWRLAAELFSPSAALVAVGVLVVIFELDFVRYYTVTLLSENLYILTVTLTVVPFVRWIREGARADLVRAGFWGGVSSITRPPMLLYLPLALALVGVVALPRARRAGRRGPAVAAMALMATVWLGVVAPVTLRNWVVARRFVLVSDVPAASLLTYNLPASIPAGIYGDRFRGTLSSALKVLAELTWDHPGAMLGVQGKKLGFSLGLIQWGGYRPHPELVAVTGLYLAMCVLSKRMRDRSLWPVHLFVLAHLASMTLTIPWNYGYRMILPPFVYTSAFGAAALYGLVSSRATSSALTASAPR